MKKITFQELDTIAKNCTFKCESCNIKTRCETINSEMGLNPGTPNNHDQIMIKYEQLELKENNIITQINKLDEQRDNLTKRIFSVGKKYLSDKKHDDYQCCEWGTTNNNEQIFITASDDFNNERTFFLDLEFFENYDLAIINDDARNASSSNSF